jgi:hypothetical protein
LIVFYEIIFLQPQPIQEWAIQEQRDAGRSTLEESPEQTIGGPSGEQHACALCNDCAFTADYDKACTQKVWRQETGHVGALAEAGKADKRQESIKTGRHAC